VSLGFIEQTMTEVLVWWFLYQDRV